MTDPACAGMEDVPTTILPGSACHLGEGPAYDPLTDTAWWFDILGRRLFEAALGSGTVRTHELPVMASMMAAVNEDRQLLAAEDGLYLRDRRDGRLTLHLPLEADQAGTRSNDGRVHPSGALWIGTMGRQAEHGMGAIYHVAGDQVRRLYANLTIPNAICFAPDGATGYFADTVESILHRVPLNPMTGLPTGSSVPLHDGRRRGGGMDGAVVDASGLIWNARWGLGCLDVYSPCGERVRSLRVPATRPSCPVFVGRDLNDLLVTTAFEGMTREERNADPWCGRALILQVNVQGKPEPRFRLLAG